MTDDARDRTACMMRVKDEARWIRRSLERTWQVCARVVILDDGSTDGTFAEAVATVGETDSPATFLVRERFDETGKLGWERGATTTVLRSADGLRELHFIRSPFANAAVRPEERVNEIRDKNHLWAYAKANVPFDHVLCLDGDEALSLEALRLWPAIVAELDARADVVHLPFVYLWDGEATQRTDGIYGPWPVDQRYPVDDPGADARCAACLTRGGDPTACAKGGHKRLRFPRLFSVRRLAPRELFDTRFEWTGTRGGFHCGSIPQEAFRPGGVDRVDAFAEAPVIHYGYIDDALRRAKHAFYNHLDPGNDFEGEYRHCVGEPDRLAPGPLALAPWVDR